MDFANIIVNFLTSITPQEWTLWGITSFLAITAGRGLFMFAMLMKMPEWIADSNLPKNVKKCMQLGIRIMEAIGVAYDVGINFFVMSFIFLDPPGGLHTFSYRMGKYLIEDDGWRNKVAQKVCKLLSKFDKGHCTKIYLNSF